MEDADCVILIDAADMGRPPGTCAVFSPGEVQSLKKDHRFSLHHADLLGLLELMRKVYHTVPAVRVVAVQPERVQWRDRLSDTIKAKIPEIVSLVRAEIHSVGERLGAGKKSRCIDGIC
jgi:hydrogenase maturation protease